MSKREKDPFAALKKSREKKGSTAAETDLSLAPKGGGLLSANSNSPFIWDRLLDETPVQFNLFRRYYELGPSRSYEALHRLTGRDETELRRMAVRFAWDLRVQQRETYQTAVLSEFFADNLKTNEVFIESILNEELVHQMAAIIQKMSLERDNPEVSVDLQIKRAERLIAMKNSIVKNRGIASTGDGPKLQINILPSGVVDALKNGKQIDLSPDQVDELAAGLAAEASDE